MVRVKINLILGEKSVSTSAIVNSGYEANKEELLIPTPLAKELGVWPKPPRGTRVESYSAVGGITKVYRLPKQAKIRLMVRGKVLKDADSWIVISESEEEVLISDSLGSAFNIEIKELKKGIWGVEDRVYKSVAPKIWSHK